LPSFRTFASIKLYVVNDQMISKYMPNKRHGAGRQTNLQQLEQQPNTRFLIVVSKPSQFSQHVTCKLKFSWLIIRWYKPESAFLSQGWEQPVQRSFYYNGLYISPCIAYDSFIHRNLYKAKQVHTNKT